MVFLFILLIFACCIVMWKASDGFDVASEYLGRNLSQGVRGATINAIGSSMPELLTTLFFLFVLHDKDGFSGGIGTTAGSAIFNGMIIPAVVILVVVFKGLNNSVHVSRKVLFRDGIALLLCELVLILLVGDNVLDWWHGLILMLLYAVYTVYMFKSMKKKESKLVEFEELKIEESEEGNNNSIFVNLLTLNLEVIFVKKEINIKSALGLLVLSMVVVGIACFLLVISCEWLGCYLNIPIYFIAVIIASAATSVPDTILSMKDAKKGNYDDAVSNALGSNIFDVCFALGFPLFLFTMIYGPIQMSSEAVQNIAELRILLFILTFVAFIIYISKPKLGVLSAFLLLLIYVGFTVFIVGKSLDSEFSTIVGSYLEEVNFVVKSLRFWE